MIIFLKILLILFSLANAGAGYFFVKDFLSFRKQENYNDLTLYQKISMTVIFVFGTIGMLSLFIFLMIFIFSKISIE